MSGDLSGNRSDVGARTTRRRRRVWVTIGVCALLDLALLIAFLWPTHPIQRLFGADVTIDGVDVVHYDLDSPLTHGTRAETALVPSERGAHPGLLLLLHGRGGSSNDWAQPELMAALAAQGRRAPVVVAVDGGDHSYYHDRQDGDWDAYVLHEVIPDAVRRFGVDDTRVAIAGHSMGGFGAFALALHHPGRFCAVGGHEPAIWRTGGETAPGAFDDAEDFARNDLVGAATSRPHPFGATQLWLDRGDRDDFIPGDDAFVAALRAGGTTITTRVWPGTHDTAYLWPHVEEPVRFYTRALAACHG